MLVHFADDLFGKQAGLSGNANQDIRLNVAHHIEQRQDIFLGIPVLEIFAFLHQFGLEGEQVRHFVC